MAHFEIRRTGFCAVLLMQAVMRFLNGCKGEFPILGEFHDTACALHVESENVIREDDPAGRATLVRIRPEHWPKGSFVRCYIWVEDDAASVALGRGDLVLDRAEINASFVARLANDGSVGLFSDPFGRHPLTMYDL